MTMATLKNPIGRVFGLVLKEERLHRHISADEICRKLGEISHSFYNLVENGTNYLHANKSLALSIAFSTASARQFSFDAVSKILVTISIIESTFRDYEREKTSDQLNAELYEQALENTLSHLCLYDADKLGKLLTVFKESNLLKVLSDGRMPTKEAEKTIKLSILFSEMKSFILDYERYGTHTVDVVKSELLKHIQDTPSIYSDFIIDTVFKLRRLPVKITRDEIWRWESENKGGITEQLLITRDPDSVVSDKNLKKYHYDILWEKNFKTSNIIFISDDSATSLKHNFEQLLKIRLEKSISDECNPGEKISNASQKLESLTIALSKIKFKCANKGTIRNKNLNAKLSKILPDQYNAINFLEFNDENSSEKSKKRYCVGFFARLTGNILDEVDNLSISEVESNFTTAKSLWRDIIDN